MATLTTTRIPVQPAEALHPIVVSGSKKRRISPESGHALEILGHAIEYLADELSAREGAVFAGNPQLEAIQILMAVNRKIYWECPEIPSWRERLQGWLHRG